MKTKLKSILAVALCAVGFAAVPSAAEAQNVKVKVTAEK